MVIRAAAPKFFIFIALFVWLAGGLFQATPNPHDNYFYIQWQFSHMAIAGVAMIMAWQFLPRSREIRKFIPYVIAIQGCLWFLAASFRHWDLHSKGWDLGIYDQAVWAASQGMGLWSSIRGNFSLLGDHFEPILFLPACLYRIWPSPLVLLGLQTICLSLSSYMLYVWARKNLSSVLSFAIVIAFTFHSAVSKFNRADFHSIVFAIPLIIGLVFFLENKKYIPAIILTAMSILVKENLLLTVAFVWFGYMRRKPLLASLMTFFCLFLFWIVVQKVIPVFSPDGHYFYFQQKERLGVGCNSVTTCVSAILTTGSFWQHLFIQKEKWLDFIRLGLPFGFIFLGGFRLFPAIALEFFLLLIDRRALGIQGHYAGPLIALLAASSMITVSEFKNLGILVSRYKRAIPIVFFWGLLFGTRSEMFNVRVHNSWNNKQHQLAEVRRLIPEDAALWASPNLVPHFSHRKYVYEWPYDPPIGTVLSHVLILDNSHGVNDQNFHPDTFGKKMADAGYNLILNKGPWYLWGK